MSNGIILSICIPSYNRPDELFRLLQSIDATDETKIEVVIREDKAPKRLSVREKVRLYKEQTGYTVNYIENDENFGYDKNIRSAAAIAKGKWVIFMGDDDVFIEGSLDKYINFLETHGEMGYVLRRYRKKYRDGREEEYRYSNKDEFLDPGEETVIEFFRRSVFISGFTYRKDCFDDYECSALDGTLLFQLNIQATACLNYPSAYCDIPISMCMEGGIPFFGKAAVEKDLYESGENTFSNSINFLKQVRFITEKFDSDHGTHITKGIIKSYAKYSYGYLQEHRDDGVKIFRDYAKKVKEIGLGNSIYFYIYYYALLILGRKKCQSLIRQIKKAIGHTPKL